MINPVDASLIAVDDAAGGPRVNLFVHGYRALTSDQQLEDAKQRVRASGAVGENLLLNWASGRWRDSATIVGLRAAYRVARFRKILSPWMILVDAGVVSLAEVAQFKFMERRAERVGQQLMPMLAAAADGRPVNLIGHSLGARVIHHALAAGPMHGVAIDDCVLLGGAADLESDDWPDCVARLRGRLYNAYSPGDRILKITPDLRRRVGGRPMPAVTIDGVEKVINHRCDGVSHVGYWSGLEELLPKIWPNCRGGAA